MQREEPYLGLTCNGQLSEMRAFLRDCYTGAAWLSSARVVRCLVKKDGLTDVARKIVEDLKWDFAVSYDEKDAVGRRYRRQDANGTPFCITVDHDTLDDNSVTVRYRDTMEQKRVKIVELRDLIKQEVDVKTWLMKM